MFHMTDMILELDDGAKTHTTNDGYLAAMPRVARTGIQLYRGSEVGMPSKDIVRIYRDESEVFKKDALKTFTGKPFTDDHPKVPVSSANWKDYSVGIVGEDVLRDGEFIRVPMILMDGKAIAKVKGGKTQLSVGYTCDIKWEPGTTADGQQYDGRQTDITVNHVAVVKAARGGAMLSIGDASKVSDAVMQGVKAIRAGKVVKDRDLPDGGVGAVCLLDTSYPFLKDGNVYSQALRSARVEAINDGDTSGQLAIDMLLELCVDGSNQKESPAMKTLIVDGVTCEMSDTAIEVVRRALDTAASDATKLAKKFGESEEDYKKRIAALEAKDAETTTKLAAADAENATLKAQLKDAEMTPAKLDALVKDRAVTGDKAKVIVPGIVLDGKSDEQIRAEVVTAKLGDAAKGWNAEQMKVSFDTLTSGVVITKDSSGLHNTARAFSVPPVATVADSDKRYDTYDAKLSEAWKTAGVQ